MENDSTRASLFVTYRVDWEIDSAAFASGSFRLALVHDYGSHSFYDPLHPVWLPKNRSIPLAARKGTFLDTSTSPGTSTYWPHFLVYLTQSVGGGEYLAVGMDSIRLQDVKP